MYINTMGKAICITLDEELYNYIKLMHLKTSEIVNEILKEKFKEAYK